MLLARETAIGFKLRVGFWLGFSGILAGFTPKPTGDGGFIGYVAGCLNPASR